MKRNPYLLLGVDYGAPPDEARRCFARSARRVRRAGAAASTTVEDLNWALHEIQSQTCDPRDSVTIFRVPANPDVFAPVGEGMFAPPPVPLPRRTTTSDTDRDQVLGGFADDLTALVGAVLPRVVRFDAGYFTTEGLPT